MTNEAKQGCVMAATPLCMILHVFAMLIDAVEVMILIFQSGTVLMESYSSNGSFKLKLRCIYIRCAG